MSKTLVLLAALVLVAVVSGVLAVVSYLQERRAPGRGKPRPYG